MSNFHSVSWNSERNANVCIRCGHLTYGMPKTGGYDECLECKKVHLMELNNAALAERNEPTPKISNRENEVGLSTGVKNALAISIIRLFLAFLLWDWILPKKAEDAAMFFATGTLLGIAMLMPNLSSLMVLSAREKIVHWLLFVGSAWHFISKFFGS